MLVIHDAGEPYLLLTRRTNAGNTQLGDAQFTTQAVFGEPDSLAPIGTRIPDFNVVVVNVEVAWSRSRAFQNQQVVAGKLEFGSPVATGIGGGDRVG